MATIHDETMLPYLKDWLYQLADDKLTIGHRDSEWLGLCPDIEGDVAFSSIAQDEVGHAVFYFELLHQLGESDPDRLAFTRESSHRRNAVLLERPNGDWIYSVVRHYFYDQFDQLRLTAMLESCFEPLRFGATKILNEETYHIIHLSSWFQRLGMGGLKAKKSLEEAINLVWTDLGDLFHCGAYETHLISSGIIPYGTVELQNGWIEKMKPEFAKIGLLWPGEIPPPKCNGRLGQHTEDLTSLLSTMTEVYEVDPAARW